MKISRSLLGAGLLVLSCVPDGSAGHRCRRFAERHHDDHRKTTSATQSKIRRCDQGEGLRVDSWWPPRAVPPKMRHLLPEICKAAGIEGLRLHDLRHSFASVAAAGGASLPIIGKLLGHTQTATTARYAHLDVDPLREVAERVGAIIEGAGKTHA